MFLRNIPTFLFVLISLGVSICILSCFGGCGKNPPNGLGDNRVVQILRVGDKLPYPLVDSNGKRNYKRAEFIKEGLINYNEEVIGGALTFRGVIELSNGVRYNASDGCVIKYPDEVITIGSIEVYK